MYASYICHFTKLHCTQLSECARVNVHRCMYYIVYAFVQICACIYGHSSLNGSVLCRYENGYSHICTMKIYGYVLYAIIKMMENEMLKEINKNGKSCFTRLNPVAITTTIIVMVAAVVLHLYMCLLFHAMCAQCMLVYSICVRCDAHKCPIFNDFSIIHFKNCLLVPYFKNKTIINYCHSHKAYLSWDRERMPMKIWEKQNVDDVQAANDSVYI